MKNSRYCPKCYGKLKFKYYVLPFYRCRACGIDYPPHRFTELLNTTERALLLKCTKCAHFETNEGYCNGEEYRHQEIMDKKIRECVDWEEIPHPTLLTRIRIWYRKEKAINRQIEKAIETIRKIDKEGNYVLKLEE